MRGASGYDDFTERNRRIAELEPLQMLCSYIYDFTALRMDGTICAYAENSNYLEPDPVKQHMARWTDIVAIDGLGVAGCIAGLKSDGTVVVSNHGVDQNGAIYGDAFEWSDIIAISKGFESLLGLKRDGTVVAAGNLRSGQENIAEWTDIVAISAGQDIHVGLKRDGTIVIAGDFGGRLELPDMTSMKDLYVPDVSVDNNDEPVAAQP